MRFRIGSLLVLTALSSTSVLSAGAARPAAERIAGEAEHILATAKETSYDHTIAIDAAAGKYQCDCSGLVAEVLRRVSPDALQALLKPAKRKRPLAEDFYATFVAAPSKAEPRSNWQHVERVADARPGDILAWKSLAHQPGDHQDTGHVMVIDESPVEVPFPKTASPATQPVKPVGQKLYRMTIIDSTKSGHADDSRKAGETGVGKGSVFLETDADGKPVAMHWKNPSATAKALPIAIGHVIGE